MGFSQGGGITWLLLCHHADFFASVAPLAGIEGCALARDELPSEEIDVLIVHGRTDRVVPYSTSERHKDLLLEAWPFGLGFKLEEDAEHIAWRWTTATGTVLELWAHDYEANGYVLGGHCFPGSQQLSGSALPFGCKNEGTFVLGEIVMRFFQDHPKD